MPLLMNLEKKIWVQVKSKARSWIDFTGFPYEHSDLRDVAISEAKHHAASIRAETRIVQHATSVIE